ncbi:MAG: NAD(P)/FAD-dependent oxidoreductase, partial [Lachnospiraceae bacterium]|nr:NAD(P)/FAD-dependent oxidoreductase [Lachnospiraceae bacterium]
MRYVILGASASGINAAKEIRRLDKKGEIILISKDKYIYSRCIMHHYLAGKRNMEQLNFAEDNFAELYNIHWMKGRECVGVEPY